MNAVLEEIHAVGANTRVNFTGLQHKMLYKHHIVCRKISHAIVVIAKTANLFLHAVI